MCVCNTAVFSDCVIRWKVFPGRRVRELKRLSVIFCCRYGKWMSDIQFSQIRICPVLISLL